MITGLLTYSLGQLLKYAEEDGCTVFTVHTRGRGNCQDVILVDEEGVTLAELRVYEKSVQLLMTSKWGTPVKASSDGSYWMHAGDHPFEIAKMMNRLVTFYVNRRHGIEEDAR